MKCPLCGCGEIQEGFGPPTKNGPKIKLGHVQQRMVNMLRSAPDGLTTEQIYERLYGDSLDPPFKHVLYTTRNALNRKLAPLGLVIQSDHGGRGGATYWLEKERMK